MLKYLAAPVAAGLAAWSLALSTLVALAAPAWEPWVSVAGVFDLGQRSDGTLLVAGSGALYTLTPSGQLTRFATGFHDDPGAEAYLAVSPGLRLPGASCDFAADDVFILRLHAPLGVTRVNSAGDQASSLANVAITSPNGIAFDKVGFFGRRLLVTGSTNGKGQVAAIDCSGAVKMIMTAGPVIEGGVEVAPPTFGEFAGSLIAPDELSGVIWAIAPDGTAKKVADSGLPKGGDIGVESLAFVPAGFTARGGYVYYSDRLTLGSPHPGSDHVLRVPSADLAAAGVRDGDLLVATEGGASMIDVRCGATCSVNPVVPTPTTAHGEGHIAFTLNPLASSNPTPTPGATPKPASSTQGGISRLTVLAIVVIVAVIVGVVVVLSRRS